jgi:CoA:oxalate CoA-transferase
MSNGALSDITVLDMTRVLSGPFAAMWLGEMGANVIKIEIPNGGDESRRNPPFSPNGTSAFNTTVNRNKRSITLDLKKEEGKDIFRQLVQMADVVLENFRPDVMDRLGLGYEELKKINPRIIYGSISGFGLEGPLSKRPCYDIIAQGMSGMMSVTGYPENPPVKIGPSVGDNYSGAYLCMGILSALYNREKTGEGQRIDVAMVDTLFSIMENFVVKYTVTGETPMRAGNIDPGIAPFDSFHAKDGDFVMGCGTNKMFAELCGAMGREELIEDPRFVTNVARCENYLQDLKPIIEEWTTTKTVAEMEEIITGLKIPFGQILTIPECAEHPQTKERNMLWNVYQPGMDREIRIPGTPVKIHGEEDVCQKAAPLLGEDNAAILASLGYSEEQVAELKANGVL